MSAPLTLAELPLQLTMVIQTLCRIIAARAGRERAIAPLVLRTWSYLNRLAQRFEALVRRVQAGEAFVARTGPRAASAAPRKRSPGLPRGFAWLIRRALEAAPIGGQLRHLLADPEMAALLAAVPQAGRILRPLCQMLGVSPGPDLPPALFRPPGPPPPPSPSPSAVPGPQAQEPQAETSVRPSPPPSPVSAPDRLRPRSPEPLLHMSHLRPAPA